MPFQPPPRTSSVLASVLAAACLTLAVAGCSHLTPLGPDAAAAMPPPRHLGSPIIVQVMRSQPPMAAGGCRAGLRSLSGPGADPSACYRPVGTPVTITSAAVSSVSLLPPPPPGHPAGPAQYGFTVVVPAADVAAVTALITQAYDSRDAFGVSAAGKLWQAPQIAGPFPGQQLQVAFLSKNQALQLYRILVPPSLPRLAGRSSTSLAAASPCRATARRTCAYVPGIALTESDRGRP